jgi:hypothetical protein
MEQKLKHEICSELFIKINYKSKFLSKIWKIEGNIRKLKELLSEKFENLRKFEDLNEIIVEN